jgi:hypothetical protein
MEQGYDSKLLEISGKTYQQNGNLVGMQLRDATNMLDTLRSVDASGRPDLLAKATILFAAAALESNLSYYSTLALAIHDAKPTYKEPEVEYLKAVKMEYTKDAELSTSKEKQPLNERLHLIPTLLGRAFERKFELQAGIRGFERLINTIERRDAIIHPRWDKYPVVGLADAVDAVYGVLEYIDSVRDQFFPYMVGYLVIMSAYGPLVANAASEPAPLRFLQLDKYRELVSGLSGDWLDAHIMFDIANMHGTKGDSDGSVLTRAALVFLYSMVSVHLSYIGRLAQIADPTAFSEKEVSYFNEQAYGMSDKGEAVLQPTKHRFENRATILPTIISKKLCPNPLTFNRGISWYQNMFKKYFNMRNGVMHSKFGECLPRVSKPELRESFESVRQYCAHIATAGGILGFYKPLLDKSPLRKLLPPAT